MPVKKAARKTKTPAKKKAAVSARKRVIFRYYSPDCQAVFVAGTFNDWNPTARPLRKDKDGVWTATMNLVPGSYEYRFVVDGNWVDDPQNQERTANEHGSHNCILRV